MVFGLLSISNAAELATLRLNNGKAMAETPIQNSSLDSNRTINSAVRVNLGDAFLSASGLPATTKTSMLVFLYTSVSGFCVDCNEFPGYTCKKEYCTNVTKKPDFNMAGPYYSVKNASSVRHAISIGDDSSNSAWELKTPALLYTYSNRISRSVSSGFPYVSEKDTYGFIGLGVGGDASNNFNTGESQIFSIKINDKGEGALIFGKNESLYDNTIPPQTVACDGNWTSKGVSMSLGTEDTLNFEASVIFDLQHPGIAIPYDAFNAEDGVWAKFTEKYNIGVDHPDSSDGYAYVYNGNVSNLQPFTITLENGGSLSIPASAYTEKIEENKYKILITNVEKAANYSAKKETDDFIVLGRSVLSKFYPVFERNVNNEPFITLYTPIKSTPVDPPKVPDYAVYIILSALIVAILMAVLGSIFLKPEKQPIIDTSYKAMTDPERGTTLSASPSIISSASGQL